MIKKFIVIFLLLLCGCEIKKDYFVLGIDDYKVTVGYDNVDYLKIAYNFDVPSEFVEQQTIEDIDIYLFDDLLGVATFNNPKKKTIDSKNAKLSKLTLYLNDLPNRTFKLNNELIDTSIKKTCDKYGGTYIHKNGYACVIEQQLDDELNVVELYGDYLNIDQDKLDRIVIYVE